MNIIERRALHTLNGALAKVSEEVHAGKLDETEKDSATTKLTMAHDFAEEALGEKIDISEDSGFTFAEEPKGEATEEDILDKLNQGLNKVAMLHPLLSDDAENAMLLAIETARLFSQAIVCKAIDLTEDGFTFVEE